MHFAYRKTYIILSLIINVEKCKTLKRELTCEVSVFKFPHELLLWHHIYPADNFFSPYVLWHLEIQLQQLQCSAVLNSPLLACCTLHLHIELLVLLDLKISGVNRFGDVRGYVTGLYHPVHCLENVTLSAAWVMFLWGDALSWLTISSSPSFHCRKVNFSSMYR